MPSNLKPFRDYDDHDVINLFAVSGASVDKGTLVIAQASGINLKDQSSLDNLSFAGNTLSAQFNVPWTVAPAPANSLKSQIVGFVLKDVRTFDENGERLIFNPRKAAEMDVIISGQAAPVLTKGTVLISGIVGTPSYGQGAAAADAGDGSLKVVGYASGTNSGICVGKFLGPKNDEGYALLKIEL
jgi:hypothetical protein